MGCVNFYKTMNEKLYVVEDDSRQNMQRQWVNQQSQLEKLTENFDRQFPVKGIADKELAEQVQIEFERFNDKDLVLLNKLVEVYKARVKAKQQSDWEQLTQSSNCQSYDSDGSGEEDRTRTGKGFSKKSPRQMGASVTNKGV